MRLNGKRGLRRLFAVAFGLVALLSMLVAFTSNPDRPTWQILLNAALGLGIVYALFRAACWVVDGFVPDNSLPR